MATYYTDYLNGSNAAAGSGVAPWQTIAYALTTCANSDTILVRGNSDANRIYLERSISTTKTGLIIQADTGHTPVIAGGEQYATWAKTAGQTNVYEAASTRGVFYGVWKQGTPGAVLASVASVAACDAASNSYYLDDGNNLLYVNIGGAEPTSIYGDYATQYLITLNGDGNTIDGLNVHYSSFGFDIAAGGTNSTLKNLTGYGYAPFTDWPLFRSNAAGTLFDHLTVIYTASNSLGRGMKGLALSGGTISNCSVSGGWYWGIEFLAGTWTVNDCTITGCSEDGISTYAATGTCELTIYNNTLYNNHHGGCTFGGVSNITLHHNTVYIDNDVDDDLYLVVFHNSGTVNCYHNVIAYGTRAGTSGQGQGFYLAPASGTLTFGARNNAFYSCNTGIDNVTGTISYDGTIDYNGFYGCTNNFVDVAAGDQGTHNVTDDPGFTDPTGYDFTITRTSTYFDTGVAVVGINDDFAGAAPDIGRYEVEVAATGDALILMMMGRRRRR